MPSNTSALPLGNHLGAKKINAGNAFLGGVAPEPARHVTHVERRQGGGMTAEVARAAVGGRTPLEAALHGRQEALGGRDQPRFGTGLARPSIRKGAKLGIRPLPRCRTAVRRHRWNRNADVASLLRGLNAAGVDAEDIHAEDRP